MGLLKTVNTWFDKMNTTAADLGAPAEALPHLPATTTQVTPVAPEAGQDDQDAPATNIVTGRFVPAGQQAGLVVSSGAGVNTEHFRQVIESFDEDKQTALEWIVRKFFGAAAYLLPLIVALVVGIAIGDAFSGAHPSFGWTLYTHVISVSLELMLPVLGLAVTIVFKRALKDRSQIGMFLALAALFLALAVGNSFAQIFLVESHITLKSGDTAGQASMIFRSFGPMIIDIVATVYLSVASVKNLQKYLADQKQKIAAIKDVNAVEIEIDKASIQADIDRQTAIMDMESKQQRATTWNEIERLQSQAMIEQARRSLSSPDEKDKGGYYRRGGYGY